MIDIHHHCLPDVDDGPETFAEAVEQCRMAAREGINTIIATPHLRRGLWRDLPPSEHAARITELRRTLGLFPLVLQGSEYFLGHDMLELLDRGEITTLAGSRYVLVELAAHTVPPHIESVFFETQIRGFVPILAHPERNAVFQQHPELLARLIEKGTKVQITAASVTGGFGDKARAAAKAFLESSMVHFVATDAHGCGARPPLMRQARSEIAATHGEEIAAALFDLNPQAVVRNGPLPFDPEPRPASSKHGLFRRIRRFFSGNPP